MITDHIYASEVEVPLNPFPGLRPFEFNESDLYFGRDGQSERMLSKLAARRFVAVVGTSGSGKSSLVRAGLLPALFGGFMSGAGSNWRVALMRPGNDPLGNLARSLNHTNVFGSEIEENARLQAAITEATLRRGSLGLVEAVRQNRMASNENLLVVVDQFEELFRFARAAGGERFQNEAAAFVKLLLAAINQREQNVYVVLTMRSDFLGDCSIFWDLPEAINESQFLIPRLTREQRREAITGPVAVCGGEMSSRLVNRLLNDTGDNPDTLPILQHALMRTWENWVGDHAAGEPVDLRHYEAVGGMTEALSFHADEAFGELPDEESRRVAEKIFKGLTEKEGDREIRRPVELRELCALTGAGVAQVVAVIETFRREGRSFLTPPAPAPLDEESLIDISHESLIRNWARLKGWVDEEAASAQTYRRLAETAALYEKGKAGLWRDPDLQIALDWREHDGPNEAWAARYHPAFGPAMKFLDESLAAREAAARREEELRRREIKRARMNRVAAVVFFLLFLLALVLFFVARRQTALAQMAEEKANAALAVAEHSVELVSWAAANERSARETEAEQRRKAEAAEAAALDEKAKAEAAKADALEKKKEAEAARADAVRSAEVARLNERRAESAKAEAERQRAEAETQRAHAESEATKNRQLLYSADISLAQQAYDAGNVTRGRSLLDEFGPRASQDYARGFEWYHLWHLNHAESDTLDARQKAVNAVAYSHDGRLLASAGDDGTVKLWDATSKTVLASLTGHTKTVRSISFSPDSSTLATVGNDRTIKLWDIASRRELTPPFETQEKELACVAFSPDGRVLATGGRDGVLRLWDAASHKLLKQLKGHESTFNAVAFSPDGKKVAAGGGDTRIWEVASGASLMEQWVFGVSILSVAFSPDGRMLVTGGNDHKVRFWDVSNQSATLLELEDHIGPVNSVEFSADGHLLASGGSDRAIVIWAVGQGRNLSRDGIRDSIRDWVTTGKDRITLRGHAQDVWSVTFSPDGRTLASGGADGLIKLWDIKARLPEQVPVKQFSSAKSVAYSPDGKTFATGSANVVKLFDSATHERLASFEGPEKAVWSVAFSPDGRVLAAGGQDKTVKLWDVGTRQRLLPDLVGHTDTVTSLAYSPDGRVIATAGRDATVKLWDAATHGELRSFGGYGKPVMCVAFSRDGRLLATGGGDGSLVVWDVESGTKLSGNAEHKAAVNSVAFSPDGRLIATASDDMTVRVWDVQSSAQLARLDDHADKVRAVAFSRDGRTLATGGDDMDVMLWDARSFKRLLTLKGHTNSVSSLAFSPDGRTLLSASFDETVRVWRAASDEEVLAAR